MSKSGYIKLDFLKNSVQKILEYSLQPFKRQFQDKEIQLDVDIPPKQLYVSSDIEKTVWVLMNLIGNALRYSNRWGRVIIKVTIKSDLVRFSVQDFGQGISPDKMSKIFSLIRLAHKKNNNTPGIGSALPISRELMEAQGGELNAESELGEGSHFYFTLPLVKN